MVWTDRPQFSRALATRLWVVVPLALTVAPHLIGLPVWLGLTWSGCAAISLMLAGRAAPRALAWLKAPLAMAGIAGVMMHYGTVLGPQGGVALLVFLSGAKLLELDRPRDRYGLLFLGCFLLVAWFLTHQEIGTAVWMGIAAIGLVAGLVAEQVNLPVSPVEGLGVGARPGPALVQAATLLGQALPLALLLFVLFPRLPAPLWGLPHAAAAGTGLSDHMRPGDIGRLILSDDLALRAEFEGADPPVERLYWRGPVFWDFDGRTWGNRAPPPAGVPRAAVSGPAAACTLTLEPQQLRSLILLGFPATLPTLGPELETVVSADLQWLTRQPVSRRLRYRLETWLDYRLDPDLDPAWRRRALALPPGNPQARALAAGWAAGGDAAAVRSALTMFRRQPFHYTLNPPPLGNEPVDDFLFASRRGFCEHYASTFVFLMRAAGVPARVVTGYQGGEFNALGKYWIVRGRDAHAWAEVWLAGQGWRQIDPTAAVAPLRVERGLDAALPAGEGRRLVDLSWLRPLQLGWDLVNQRWNQWVLGYDFDRQHAFLTRFSPTLASLQGMVWTLVAAAALVVAALSAWLFLSQRRDADPVQRAWLHFRKRLARIGLEPAVGEAPEVFARRAAAARPDLAGEIGRIAELYLGLRYGQAPADTLLELRGALRAFQPSRHARPIGYDESSVRRR